MNTEIENQISLEKYVLKIMIKYFENNQFDPYAKTFERLSYKIFKTMIAKNGNEYGITKNSATSMDLLTKWNQNSRQKVDNPDYTGVVLHLLDANQEYNKTTNLLDADDMLKKSLIMAIAYQLNSCYDINSANKLDSHLKFGGIDNNQTYSSINKILNEKLKNNAYEERMYDLLEYYSIK